jgi:hypothetical protein
LQLVKKGSWRQYGEAIPSLLLRRDIEQIWIVRDQVLCPADESGCEDHVVVRIGARSGSRSEPDVRDGSALLQPPPKTTQTILSNVHSPEDLDVLVFDFATDDQLKPPNVTP